ncbi:flagellar biosynthesis anti-sigma factor FlgM [Helicobacter marmotae]|uniref:Flagellar biosynthesis protein FlgM n=1 Tax=Helicobacter marmotae TaxID=152490 RepID=A0A3D8I7F3_9HELI|nr:flagellar biosynthesis anti-sigma factor FlgM [Helicobacter marmotae]RDU61068.1 flagellar biosynthesis protein FlgM [Helicobacter marmotae]
MINSVNTSVSSANVLNRDLIGNKQNESNEVKEKEQAQLSKAEQIKEQIKNGDYKIDLQQTSDKMASNLLNL